MGSLTSGQESFDSIVLPAIKQHCIRCHSSNQVVEGDVDLGAITQESLGKHLDVLQQMIDVLEFKEMPPEDEPQPKDEDRARLIESLKSILKSQTTAQGIYTRTPVRRMTRFQYNNAVTDLFDLRCVVFSLPERMMREHKSYFKPESGKMADMVSVGSRPLGKSQLIERRLAGVVPYPQDLRAEHGFDVQGDHLSLSPLLMEAFLKLGQTITQSRDFGPRNVGIWQQFFEAPKTPVNENEIRSRLKPFLTKAFRRPIESGDLDRYVQFVQHKLKNGDSFTQAMKAVAAATISSPRFFYLYNQQSNVEEEVSFDLISRLSFFLWGSIPDEELLKLASDGSILRQQVLEDQVERMLNDRKLKRFCDSFPAQWLQLDRIVSSTPNRSKFPSFYFSKYRKSMHMMLEPLLIFETILIEDLPITQLVDSDFTYRSGFLNNSYGELKLEATKNLKGNGAVGALQFGRLKVTDRRVGGVITNAAVMTMTSGPERTKPITRGAWVATVIFNNPPEPPPANVPELDEEPPHGQENLTLRERLDLHRERADCNGCHQRIDPLGFALENFDAVGNWRNRYENNRDVDMAGVLFRQHEFNDVIAFKDAILKEKEHFARGFGGHVLSFALGRPLDAGDQVALDKITQTTIDQQYKIKTLIKQVVLSEPFRQGHSLKSNASTRRSQTIPSGIQP